MQNSISSVRSTLLFLRRSGPGCNPSNRWTAKQYAPILTQYRSSFHYLLFPRRFTFSFREPSVPSNFPVAMILFQPFDTKHQVESYLI